MHGPHVRTGQEERGQSVDCGFGTGWEKASNWYRLPDYHGPAEAYLTLTQSYEETPFGHKPYVSNADWCGDGRVIELYMRVLCQWFPGIDVSRPFVLGSLSLTPIGKSWGLGMPVVYAVRREDLVGRWLAPAWGRLWRLGRQVRFRLWLTACV